jgi:ipoprotein LpqH
MNRVVVGVVGLAAAAAVLVGCSDDKSGAASATAAGGAQVSSGGSTEVKVDGNDLAGLDVNSVTCVKQGGKINVASGAVGGQQGLAVVMTDEATPKVESLGMVVDGNALAVTNSMGAQVGKADAARATAGSASRPGGWPKPNHGFSAQGRAPRSEVGNSQRPERNSNVLRRHGRQAIEHNARPWFTRPTRR